MKEIKNHYLLFFTLIGLMFINCDNKDDSLIQENKQRNPIEYISLSDFNSEIRTNETSNKLETYFDINKKNRALAQSKGVTNDDLILITDKIIKITKNDTIYYTFKVITSLAKNSEFYNLIVYTNRENQIFKSELYKYTPESGWLEDINQPYKGRVTSVDSEISISESTLFNRSSGNCLERATSEWICNYGHNHAPGQGRDCTSWQLTITLHYGPCPDDNTEQVAIIVDSTAPGGGGGGGGGGGTTPNNGTPTIPTTPCVKSNGTKTIGITDGSGDCLENNIPFDKALFNLTAEMSLEQTTWWNAATFLQKNQILSYINNQVDFNAAVAFAIQFIEQSRLNPTLNFDLDASSKSPYNIDRSEIDNNTPEGQRFNEVYDALKNVPEFRVLFTDIFDGPQTRLNVKFEIQEHVYSANNPNNIEVAGTTESSDNQNDNNYIIKINKQGLIANGTIVQNKLENAHTIAHEAAHAFLHHLLKNPNSIATIQNIDQKDLKEILNALQAANPDQHEIIFNKLTETIAEILSSLKNVLTTPAQRAMVEDLQIPESQDPQNPNSQIWNWDTYFQYLSYIGLQGTIGFNAQFPPNSDVLNKFTLYITYGKAYLNL